MATDDDSEGEMKFNDFCDILNLLRIPGSAGMRYCEFIYAYVSCESMKDITELMKNEDSMIIDLCCNKTTKIVDRVKLTRVMRELFNIRIEYTPNKYIWIRIGFGNSINHRIACLDHINDKIPSISRNIDSDQLVLDCLKDIWKFMFGHVWKYVSELPFNRNLVWMIMEYSY